MMSNSPFSVIPVLDLLRAQVVHGVAGNRTAYRPIQPSCCPSQVALRLGECFAGQLSESIYVADLDALQGGRPQIEALNRLAADVPTGLWLDAGIANANQADELRTSLVADPEKWTFVVASETLGDWDDLESIVEVYGVEKIVFSLDLRNGQIRGASEMMRCLAPIDIVRRVVELGIRRLVVLDVAHVGIRGGVETLGLCRDVRASFPTLQIITGGGIRTVSDLSSVREAGCVGALVATALHEQTISPESLADWQSREYKRREP